MCDTDQTARDRDAEHKQRGKDYADRNARDSNIDTGDKVLLQQAKKDKLSTSTELEAKSQSKLKMGSVMFAILHTCGNSLILLTMTNLRTIFL